MKARLTVRCSQCNKRLGKVDVDTADMPEDVQRKLNTVILKHRAGCWYYGGKPEPVMMWLVIRLLHVLAAVADALKFGGRLVDRVIDKWLARLFEGKE